MFKAVFFDFDGVITESHDTGKKVLRQVLRKLDISVDYERLTDKLEKLSGMNLKDKLAIVMPEKAEEIYDAWLKEFDKIYEDEVELIHGANDLIKKLHESGMTLFILSTKYDRFIHRALKKFKLDSYFEMVIGREQPFAPKPSAEGVNFACKKYGLKKSEVVLIGDSETDGETAKNARIKFIYFECGEEWSRPEASWKEAKTLSLVGEIILKGA